MATVEKFEDLEVWQLARELCQQVFRLSQETDLRNDFALKRQINRSSGSVMDNIAEGFERNGRKEFIQFLSIAKGSCGEVRSQLHRIQDRGFVSQPESDKLQQDCRMLSGKLSRFISYLSTSAVNGVKYKR